MNIIEAEQLSYRYRQTYAVDGMNLSVPEGSIFALLGPNGAGKTTTIKLLMNLLSPSKGSVKVLGVDSRRLGPAELAQIGYVSENQKLPLWMTVGGLADYCRPLYPTWDASLEKDLLNQFELPRDRKLQHLSRGLLMKAALLVSLAYRPKLLVLDEPFSGLDPLSRDEFARGLLEASTSGDWSILISTHDIEEVERLCDWIGTIDSGRVRSAEATDHLLQRHRSVAVSAAGLPLRELPRAAGWIDQEQVGDVMKFIDSAYSETSSEESYRQTFPGATISVRPMSLREIFIAQSRAARSARKGAAS
jgi:ABC-2 type transport system ATP-binding protein